MNVYSYEDINIGMQESFSALLTKDYIDAFRKYTGDINPLHNDDEFAKSKGYEGKVVFGMLTASFYSTLAGVYLPGQNSLIHSVEVKFLKPVRLGLGGAPIELLIAGTVIEKDDRFKLLTIKASIAIAKTKEKVSKAIIKAGVI
ncbi:MAG: hypothetical protein LBN20_05455 [Endomicrobium sp.]|jgi:3-hydroxybutyryl-CoA dehydratase|nr:hypothetical protein [Endomicrobium sp.]